MAAHIEKAAGYQDHHQNQRQDNQEVADLHHRPLEVRNVSGACHQFCSAAKKGVRSGCSNHCNHFSLFDDRPRVCVIARFLCDRQRFSRERGLVDADVIASDELTIPRNYVAEVQANNISGDERLSIDLLPFSTPKHARL